MEKLTLEHIAPYGIGHEGLRFNHFDDERIIKSVCRISSLTEEEAMLTDNENEYVEDIEDLTPILRPMDLTKPITIDNTEVIPIVELAKMTHIKENFTSKYIDSCYGYCDGIKYSFCYYQGSFYIKEKIGRKWITKTVFNQLQMFKWLYANKFDVDGLIDAGLAIDADTLETNPYNS